MKNIRNFCIISHIDHGKSTLSKSILKFSNSNLENNIDNTELEKEKEITIKSKNINFKYKLNDYIYNLNLIDTPGHTDFLNEIYKYFLVCEGAILLIDSTKSIESQTLYLYNNAIKYNVKIITVINKIDSINSDINNTKKEIIDILNIKNEPILVSAKYSIGIDELLNNIINKIPYPKKIYNDFIAIIIDSWFDKYLGILLLIKIKQGKLTKKDTIKFFKDDKLYKVNKLGIINNNIKIECDELLDEDIGWISCSIKEKDNINFNNILISNKTKNIPKKYYNFIEDIDNTFPKIYANIIVDNINEYNILYNSIKKISINDTSLYFDKNLKISKNGFKCGFSGTLHIEIFKERLKREFNINIKIVKSNVLYEILTKEEKIIKLSNINDINNFNIKEFREPICKCIIITIYKYINNINKLCFIKRGKLIYSRNININFIELIYDIPMSEIIYNFFDELKSISKGYVFFNYNFKYFKKTELFLLEVLINNKKINELTFIVNKNYNIFCENLINKIKKNICRKQFDIKIQILINKNIVKKCIIKRFRKDVISKCYGGDINRKKKLLKNQKIKKKYMNKTGLVNITSNDIYSIIKI
ncbi:elongation factor 4 [endosymbiont of Sipalinus gigas]|uniref:GTP-binding protein n=1 Tax=endosymbiont of Sipalinus gigas TaxID=1972134 RepID=UPI000DC72F42|nr:GTP-binding protein [endosymbiont of Sipalinus gigas]BBA85201.1 elongation factor 4 [endosymbiont of Sipalinus gigas]